MNLRVLRCLIRRTDSRKLLDLACSCLLVQALGITLLSDLDRYINVNFDKFERRVAGCAAVGSVEVTGDLAVCSVGGDEGGDGDSGGVCEEFGNLKGQRVHRLAAQLVSFVRE